MNLHRKGLSCIMVLAWMMEVKLHEPVRAAIMGEHTAFAHVHLDRMAVIHDSLGVCAPIYFELQKGCFEGVADVDRRLLHPGGANPVRRIEISPVLRAFGTFIAP